MSYRKVNETFRRRMVYHVGVDCGFFVEMNYMVDAMLYCLAHCIRFQLYSDDANFGTGKGWTEYFQPFCEEIHEPLHQWCNFHRPPSWRRILKLCKRQKAVGPIVWKLKSIQKTAMGHLMTILTYKEYVLLGQDVPVHPDHHYRIPDLDINADYTEAYGLLARMIWKHQPDILYQMAKYRECLTLPPLYDSIHIRGGDKMKETCLISEERILQMLNPKDGTYIFVLTDDYRKFQKLQRDYPHLRFMTLCMADETGYHHLNFSKLPPCEKKRAIIKLLTSVELLLHSRSFVGSITTGPSVFVMKLRAGDPYVQAVDCPRENMISSLSKTIDVRASISKKNMQL